MKSRVLLLPLLLLLATCGARPPSKGSVGWDAGEALLEIVGTGAYTLELENSGTVPVEFHGSAGWPVKVLAPGDRQYVTGTGARSLRLVNASGEHASIDYVFQSDAKMSIDALIP